MSQTTPARAAGGSTTSREPFTGPAPANLADILERVLDKGIIIAGDIQVNLLDIELLTIRIRLLVVSVDKAQEMGIDWWKHDRGLTASARELEDENRALRERLDELESSERSASGSAQRSRDRDRS
jgi:hypothetical protein